jgi:hypothetical protein
VEYDVWRGVRSFNQFSLFLFVASPSEGLAPFSLSEGVR